MMTTRGQFNSKSPTIRRILREASELSNAPSPDYTAVPLDDNLFEWHFTLRGPPGDSESSLSGGPYNGGMYHGRIVLPPTYPLRPPSFRFSTPSGRFETNREICLSISGHHEETWQPAWGLRTALVALRSFMETDPKGQLGGLDCTEDMRRRMAKASRSWKCNSCRKTNEEILNACQEAAKLVDAKPDETVPKELRMGWKDEIGKNNNVSASGEAEPESAELAEGFVRTAPDELAREEQAPQLLTTMAMTSSPPRHGDLQPTEMTAETSQRRAQTIYRAPQVVDDGVPVWVDKAIIGILVCLIAMILKLFM